MPAPLVNDLEDVQRLLDQLVDAQPQAVQRGFAAGDLKLSAVPAAQSGWLLCDGAAYSRTGYAQLFNAIGTAYGAGDGSTTFNVPDFRGRAVVGAGTGGGLTARARGQTGGEETHLLTTAEMPSHNHAPLSGQFLGTGASNPWSVGSGGGSLSTQVTTANQGGGGAHNNMQPFAVANYFIKT